MKVLPLLAALLGFCSFSLQAGSPHHPSLPSPTVPEGLGVNIHFTDPRPGEMEMLAEAGFRWVRMDFSWSRTERERGKYDFAAYDRLLTALEPHKIRALFILDYSNKLYEPEHSVASEEGRQAFARWAAAAVTHFKGHGILWEIWNEPNIKGFWKPEPNVDQYAALALAASKAIRTAIPGEAVIGPASSTIDLKFLERCFKAGLLEHWDAVSVHPYRQTGPEAAEPEYAKLRQLITKYAPKGKSIPILSAEWGYSAAWKNFDEEKQGRMLPRELLINLANQVPLSIWYDWHDDGKDPNEPEHHFGSVAHEYHAGRSPVYDPKPAYLAAKTLTTTLSGYQFVKRIATGGAEDYALLFAKGDELRLAVWTASPTPIKVTLPSGKCAFDVLSHTGEPQPTIVSDGKSLTIPATGNVLYLTAKAPNPELLNSLAAHPLRATLVPATGSFLGAQVENLSDSAFRGTVRLTNLAGVEPKGAEQVLELAPWESGAMSRFPLTSKPAGEFSAGLRIEREGATILELPACRFAPVPEALWTAAKTHSEGDAKVASDQSLTLAPAAEPFPDSTVPVQQLTFRMDAGWRYTVVTPGGSEDGRKIPGEPKAFGIWIHGNTPSQGTMPRLRVIDATGQCWQPSGGRIDWTGWKFVRMDLNPSCGHWGGKDDGIIHFPLKWNSFFLLDKLRDQKAEGTLHLAAPVVIY